MRRRQRQGCQTLEESERFRAEGLEFIIDEEGMDQPWRFPGGDSGVTLGHGYDLGAGTESKAEMVNDWKPWLTGNELERLSVALGKTGHAAKALCPQFRDINISIEAADDVFFRATVPKYYQKTPERLSECR